MGTSCFRMTGLFPLLAILACAPAPGELPEPPGEASAQALSTARWSRTFQSDESWSISGGITAQATPVCLQGDMLGCPKTGSVLLYNFAGTGWDANLTLVEFFPAAKWIWDAGHVASGTPGALDGTTVYKFFQFPGSCPGGVSGQINIAADDFAEVRVNGIVVGAIGSTTDPAAATSAQSVLHHFDFSPYLSPGALNLVEVQAVNGAFGCSGCGYSQNPAGVAFAGSLACL
jgi:hypothetical protein